MHPWNFENDVWINHDNKQVLTVEEWDNLRCKRIAQLESELAGMRLMEMEGASFAEGIVRENEQLRLELDMLKACNKLGLEKMEQLQAEREALIEFLQSFWQEHGWAEDYIAYMKLPESTRKQIEGGDL